jgi:diphosphomevalonate decarboxylase
VLLWRSEGLNVYYTIDTGANIHVLCLPKDEKEVVNRLKAIKSVMEVHANKPGDGATLLEKHLF